MPFSEHSIYFVANTKLKEELEKDPVLSYNLYWIKPGTIKNIELPEDGLFVVREVTEPSIFTNNPHYIPWDAIWSKKRYDIQLYRDPTETLHKHPPARMLERIYELTIQCKTKAFYYSIDMHGGDVYREHAWILAKEHTTISYEEGKERVIYINNKKEALHGDTLYLALTNIGAKKVPESGWFEPHANTSIWDAIRVSPPINKNKKLPAFSTSLYRSVQLGDYEAVKKCLDVGISPLDYQYLLEAASASGNVQIVKEFIDRNVKVRNWWNGPLNCSKNEETIELLLKHGAEINHESNPLTYIAKSGNEKAVRYMIERGAKIQLHEENKLWFSACKGGILFLVQQLYPKVDPEYEYIDTGITFAAENNRLNVVKWLFEKGVALHPETLVYPAKNNHIETVDWLLKHTTLDINVISKHGDSPLYAAANNDQLDMVTYLLDHGANPNEKRSLFGFSPLHAAVSSGNIEIIKELLNAGASINCKTDDGRTPFWIAVENDLQEIAEYLLDEGADPHQKGGYSYPIHEAVRNGNIDILKKLLDLGISIDCETEEGKTPLWIAVEREHQEIAQYLISKVANLHQRAGYHGHTPLHEATYLGNIKTIEKLLAAGASIDFEIEKGKTALWIAVRIESQEIVDYLIQKGASTDLQNEYGETLQEMAKQNNIKL